MSYEVVARRWRPLTFASVVGQSHVTQTLANAIRRDRLPHAFLLTGTRGVGKTTIARLLARAINCTQRPEGSAEPCNQCPSCQQNLAGSALDIIEIDGASNTGVDDVRGLIESAQYRPSTGRFKVFIIDEVHQLSKSAFNALLKTLEEPPSHVKFIMATTEVHKLPATVLSRCQRYDFRRLTDDEIARQLANIAEQDGMQIAPDAIALLAREADGSMRDAQSLLEQVMAGAEGALSSDEVARLLGVAGADLVAGVVESIVATEPARIIDLLGEVKRYGYDIERLLGEVLEVLRHLTVVTVAGADALAPNVTQAHRELATRLKGRRSALDLHRIFQSLLQTASDLRRGTHPDLVLEMGLLKVATFEPVETAQALLAKLGALKLENVPASSGPAPRGVGTISSQMPPESGSASPAPSRGAITSQMPSPPSSSPPPARGAISSQMAAQQKPAPAAPAAPPRSAREEQPPPPDDEYASRPPAPRQPAPPRAPAPSGERLPLAGKPNPDAVEAWTGPEGEPIAPLSEEEAAARRWEAFLDDIKKRYGLDLYVTITNCRAVSITPECVEIAPINATFASKLRNPTVMSRVGEVARAHFGENVEVRVVDASAASGEGMTLQGIQDERTAKKRQSALDDPFVGKAISDLGGRVTKISVIEE